MMRYGRYNISCILKSDAILPLYKGSTFRGVFGIALKRVVCALKNQECPSCLLRSKCVYSLTFELSPAEAPAESKKRVAAPPHPYVIEPANDEKQGYKAGERFNFSLILFGEINDSLPYFVYAIKHMGETGIGKRINGRRPGFELDTVTTDDGRIIFDHSQQTLAPGQFSQDIKLEDCRADNENIVTDVTVALLTPLRLKFDNRLESNLPFHILIRAALRRISSLSTYYGRGEPDLDYRGLVKRAEQIRMNRNGLTWIDWRRYSNRQDQAMLMGGITGSVRYEGDLAEFLPLLRLSEKLHLGKQTTFGLGRITVTENRT